MDRAANSNNLIGTGLYAPSEVARLTGVSVTKIVRWFRGHKAAGRRYHALWSPSISAPDEKLYLSFRDLTEIRVADAFIEKGLSAQKVRRAIQIAQLELGEERPLSSARFRTDGRTIFLQVANEDGDVDKDQLLDLFKSQLAFKRIIEPSLKDVDFRDSGPFRWWIAGRDKHILLDPEKSFGRPIEEDSSIPTSVLANAFSVDQSFANVARAFGVSPTSVRRSVEFEQRLAA